MSITPQHPTPPPGLPPVAPPTARFVMQLFIVPGLIVMFLVGITFSLYYFFGLLFGSPSPEQFLKRLDDPNTEVRWRAAAELSQRLMRDDRLASDADFSLKLAERLKKAHANNKDSEEAFAKRVESLSKDDAERERKKLEGERNYIEYLCAALGNFMVPVGVPVLKELALQQDGMEPKALFHQRCQAVWALIVLGEKSKHFDKLNAVEQANILAHLDDAIERGEHADWATGTRDYLQARQAGQPTTMGVDEALESCATANQPYLRQLAAMGLNFWNGTSEENERIVKTLEKLSYDDGHGEEEQKDLVGENPDGTTALTHKPGRQVCYNATLALARRGSNRTRVGMLEEMLSEDDLREVFRNQSKDGADQPDESAVLQTILITLQLLPEMQKLNPELVTEGLRSAVGKLTTHSNAAVATEAIKTQLAVGAN